jgi:hypothetical protein
MAAKRRKQHKNKISVGYNWLSIGNNRQKKSETRCQKLRAGWNETVPELDSQRNWLSSLT